MKLTVPYLDSLLDISITPAAAKELEERSSPLYVDMRLYFGCMPKKDLIFDEVFETEPEHEITSKLFVRYQSLISNSCKADDSVVEYELTPKQIGQPVKLGLDFVDNQWVGEYGLKTEKNEGVII